MIKVENLNKSIDSKKILNSCNMHVPKGSVYGLVGPNGAGKSTIIRHIVGAMRPDEGTILLDGKKVYENAEVKSEIAFIPDEIFYHLTDNIISLMKFYKGLYKTFDEGAFYELLKHFPAIEKSKMIRSYSKGMQRQAAFILSLCIGAKVMILDEPLDGLDPVMRKQILSMIVENVANREMTVLISSHNLRELEDICDHVGIMNEGQIVIERSLSDLQATVSKMQIAFEGEMPPLPDFINVLHRTSMGRVHTLIVKGNPKECEQVLLSLNPILLDIVPLTLEEIFIYEMGGVGYGA